MHLEPVLRLVDKKSTLRYFSKGAFTLIRFPVTKNAKQF